MTNTKDIKQFYFINLLSSVFGGIGGFLILGLLSQEDYGLFSLFLTFILQFMILSFGFPDGLLIDYREENGNIDIGLIKYDIKFAIKFEIKIIILSLIVFNILNFLILHLNQNLTIIINYAICGMLAVILIEIMRCIFISLKDFKKVAIIDAFNKSYLFLLIIPLFFIRLDVFMLIFLDVFLRGMFIIILIYSFFKKHNNVKEIKNEHPKRHFKKGLFLLIGNWLVILIYGLDKMFLSTSEHELGVYTQALFFFGIIYQIVMPFKDVIFVKINEQMSNEEIFHFSTLMLMSVYLLISVFSFILIPLILFLCQVMIQLNEDSLVALANQFLDYTKALELSKYLVLMIPTYITVQLVLDNLLMIKMQQKYAFKTLINYIIVFSVYVICINFIFKNNLLSAVSLGTIINSVILYFNNIFSVTNIKIGIISLIIMLITIGIYILALNYVILQIVFIIFLIIIVFILYKGSKNLNLER